MSKLKFIFPFTILVSLSVVSDQSFSGSATGVINANVVTPITILAGDPLEFGSFTASRSSGTINQAGVATGGVTAISGGSRRNVGTFAINGGGNTSYSFILPTSVVLKDAANNIMTANLSFASGNSSRTLNGGSEIVEINGSLAVASNQAVGAYSGTYDVSVNY